LKNPVDVQLAQCTFFALGNSYYFSFHNYDRLELKQEEAVQKVRTAFFFAVFNLKYYLRVAQKTSNG